ncbi:MAG: secretion system protein [Chloroflexi bacterium]|nr:MAG: secretion system protein [Chloroflexota bacterium]TMG00230.1 MAG: secretion system protein [Chloroflexota bacterium]
MNGVFLLSLMAAAGVVVAAVAVALPAARAADDGVPRWEQLASPRTSLRSRLNQPFQALAERSNRQHRLNGGLTLAEQLARADLKFRTSEFVMIQVGFLAAGALFSFWRFGFSAQVVVAGVIAYLLPMRYVKWRQRRRLKAFNTRLPDTLSLLANAMKAGLSLPQAIESVASNTSKPISDEFARVVRETRLGTPTPAALTNMVRRVGSEDLDLIVTAITIQSNVGGNLARILDSISHTIRQRVQIKSQIGAMTAQMRASGWIITLLPLIVAGILTVITPTYFRPMFDQPLGRLMLGVAGISIFIGNVLIRKITSFRV